MTHMIHNIIIVLKANIWDWLSNWLLLILWLGLGLKIKYFKFLSQNL